MSLYLPTCLCSCHQSITNPAPIVGFDPLIDSDVVAAATACSVCQPRHSRIFDKPRTPYKPLPVPYSTDTDGETKGEGAES